MASYYDVGSSASSGLTPQMDVGAILKSGSALKGALGSVKEREVTEAAEQARLKQQEFGNKLALESADRAQAQAVRQKDEYDRGVAEKLATNEGMAALLNPEAYRSTKLMGEQAGIKASLANLSPEDRAVAEKELAANYNKVASGEGWLTSAANNPNANAATLLSAKKADYDIKSNTVGTPEYIAKRDAVREDTIWKLDQETKYKNAQDRFRVGLENEASGKDAYTGVMTKINQIAKDTPKEPTPRETEVYKSAKLGADAKVNMFMDRAESYTAKGEKVPDTVSSLLQKAVEEQKALQKPTTTMVAKPKDKYLVDISNILTSANITNPKALNSILSTVDSQTKLLYPKTEGLSVAQLYKMEQDKKKEVNSAQSALSLGEAVWGEKGLKEKRASNPNMTPDTMTKLAQADMDKYGKYKKGSIVSDISKLITDGDTNSYGNVAAKKEVLEKILDKKFDGKKADMTQAIKGYYDLQGSGFHKNWAGGSPIGDALDNFIAAQGY